MSLEVIFIYPHSERAPMGGSFPPLPPLGLGYLAAYLRENGLRVGIVDGTFLESDRYSIEIIRRERPKIIGVYAGAPLADRVLRIAKELRGMGLLIAGGPLPTANPEAFSPYFDAIVQGEGEITLRELAIGHLHGEDYSDVPGIFPNRRRSLIADLDSLPTPARDLFPNDRYQRYWQENRGYKCTSLITTRGYPSDSPYGRSVFGSTYRERYCRNVVDEMEEIASLGYDRIRFVDDDFTFNPNHVERICDEIIARKLRIPWECAGRFEDDLDESLLEKMREAGCCKISFEIESISQNIPNREKRGFERRRIEVILKKMRKIGMESEGFVTLGYPGERGGALRRVVNLTSHLPVDRASFGRAYPLPRTQFAEGEGDRTLDLRHPPLKGLKFAMRKGEIQLRLSRIPVIGKVLCFIFEKITDLIFIFFT
ncbi:MAG: B12-binding domain-containing radical SAM protein [bacterium]